MPHVIAALVLGAGSSERFGADNKLLANIAGKPMIAHVVDNLLEAGADPVIVVTGHGGQEVQAAVLNRPLKFVENPNYANGLSSSIRIGIKALPEDAEAVLIALGDMPLVKPDELKALMEAFDPDRGASVCVPVHERIQGNPVLWGARHFDALAALSGDSGAKALIDANREVTVRIEMGPSVLRDVDHAAALAALRLELDTE